MSSGRLHVYEINQTLSIFRIKISGVLRQIIVKVRNTLFKGSANKRQITIVTNLFII